MPAAHRAPSLDVSRDDADAPSCAFNAAPAATAGLSNDYLNLYSEVMMLIELAGCDPEMGTELLAWRPLDYRTYFALSPLRRAPAALAAYEALGCGRRQAFEELTQAMDRLAQAAIAALQPPVAPEEAGRVVEAAVPAFRRLIDRAASFLNSGGEDFARDGEVEAAQAVIDRLIDRSGE